MAFEDVVLNFARQVKHSGFVASKRASRTYEELRWRGISAFSRSYSRRTLYEFDPSRYRRSFVVRSAPADTSSSDFPRRVFAVWTGNNDLTPHRARNLDRLMDTLGVPLELVTPSTVDQWVVPGEPPHSAYKHLSLVHRSDYLRAYLLHHHGGGYVDIKNPLGSWLGAFEAMEADPGVWVSGYGEINAKASTRMPGPMGRDIALHYPRLIGTSAILARSHTAFTGEWLREVNRRMDYYAGQLSEFPGGARGEACGYPISWTHLLGRVYQPLQLKYLERVRVDDSLLLEFENYQ